MNSFRTRRLAVAIGRGKAAFAGAGAVLLGFALMACSGVAGSALPASRTSPVSVSSPSSAPTTTALPTSAGPVCDNTHAEPAGSTPGTPTGKPIITVTQGVNSWIANWAVEPLGLAVYANGTAIIAKGIGERAKPLPQMTIGFVPSCTLDWVQSEIRQLTKLDMGQAGVSDQGTTTLTFTPTVGDPVDISVYALGIGDGYVMTGKENRARFSYLLATIEEPLVHARTWIPDRLRIVEEVVGTTEVAALTWPGPVPVQEVLSEHRGSSRCGVVSGRAADLLLRALGSNPVLSEWSDAGRRTVLQVGALVPGQIGCTDTD